MTMLAADKLEPGQLDKGKAKPRMTAAYARAHARDKGAAGNEARRMLVMMAKAAPKSG